MTPKLREWAGSPVQFLLGAVDPQLISAEVRHTGRVLFR